MVNFTERIIHDGFKVNVNGIVKQWHFPLTSHLKKGCGYILLADHTKWAEFKAIV